MDAYGLIYGKIDDGVEGVGAAKNITRNERG